MIASTDLKQNQIITCSSLSIDHPLSPFELEHLQEILSSVVHLSQIDFRDDVDVKSIEKVKLLLEMLPNIDDGSIEKYVMKVFDDRDRQEILDLTFTNMETWNIAYAKDEHSYLMTSFAKYREISEWFRELQSEIDDTSLSNLEKICCLYDKVKLFEYNDNSKYNRLPDIIHDKKATSYGYNLLFQESLKLINVPTSIEKLNFSDEESFVCLSYVSDSKYDVEGLYIFDPSSDTIDKAQYKNNWARRINYNFFAISLDKLSQLKLNGQPSGLLKILSYSNDDDFLQQYRNYSKRPHENMITKIENIFNMSIFTLFEKRLSTVDLPKESMLNLINKRLERYPSETNSKDFLYKTIKENYEIRNAELFNLGKTKEKNKIDQHFKKSD